MTLTDGVLFGAAYYHEYQPYERLKDDFRLMADARFSVIRVGESVWSTWEPQEGRFDLDWLQPVLDEAHTQGIGVIIGTPTYAVPPWLRESYPETAAQRATGQPIPYGHRQDVDFTHPAFRFLAERLIRKIVARNADHPAVIGWQVDNEPGLELLHNGAVFRGFLNYLAERYGSVEALNDRWGLTYWSHRISRWDELWAPAGNTTPAYDLEWRRYQAALTTEFIAWQAALVRELARPHQFVTTCISLHRPAVEPTELAQTLDVTATNLYYPMQDALALPSPSGTRAGQRQEDIPASGTWRLYQLADTSRGLRQEPFLVTETNAISVGDSHLNFPAFPGQWRQAAWALVARGARTVEYWHWHSLHFGHETYWGGVLGHSLVPGRCYEELAQIGAEFKSAGPGLAGLVPDADVLLLSSAESKWAMEFQPPLALGGTQVPDRGSYLRIFDSFYRSLFEAGLQVGIRTCQQLPDDPANLASRWPLVVVPGLYIAREAELQYLAGYAEAGGHLVLGFRSGYADEYARPRPVLMPGVLRAAVGASYNEYTHLGQPVPVVAEGGFECEGAAAATSWLDGVVAENARVLARYVHPFYGRWAAITTNEVGRGRVTYVGTLPSAELGRSLARWLRMASLPADSWHDRPESVTVTSGRRRDGTRLWFLSNWSWDRVGIPAAVAGRDILADTAFRTGARLELGPWDVRVLAEQRADG
jgi:beta-galactosidase